MKVEVGYSHGAFKSPSPSLIHNELIDISDTFVYLFSPSSGRGPSFKLQSYVYSSSHKLTELAFDGDRRASSPALRRKPLEKVHPGQSPNHPARLPGTPPATPPRNNRTDHSSSGSSRHTRGGTRDSFDDIPRLFNLHLPLSLDSDGTPNSLLTNDDIDALVGARNLFAFLVGQSLVATDQRHSIFGLFLHISHFLEAYDFTNIDGSTFGEIPAATFAQYVEELKIGDVRSSREKTIEALVLGERMRSVTLFNEGFTHAVGKYEDIQTLSKLAGPGAEFNLLSSVTRTRMERASIDLDHRVKSVQTRLLAFDFPSMFAGVMSSRTVSERKHISFDAWKSSFLSTRRHVLGYYKQKFGSWPPKANSKKNNLESGGLNRLVLKALYADFSDMYDLYVDRTSLTTRSMSTMYSEDGEDMSGPYARIHRILRRVCDESDRSYPPIQPPVPFDLPLLPTLGNDAKLHTTKLSEEQANLILDKSSNADKIAAVTSGQSSFLTQIRAFERRHARGSTMTDLVDFRAGMWIFMYAVLQSLPMLVIDAPGLQWHQGVEYFLCQPPRGGVPWVKGVGNDGGGSGRNGMNWYGVSGGQGVVNLPSDLIEHGVEGVYRRSHCWIMAAKWTELGTFKLQDSTEDDRNREIRDSLDAQLPRPSLADPWGSNRSRLSAPSSQPGSRANSPGTATRHVSSDNKDRVLSVGLEALPVPPGVAPASIPSRPSLPRPRWSEPGTLPPVPISDSSGDDNSSNPRSAYASVASSTGTAPRQESVKAPVTTFNDILSSMGKKDDSKKGNRQKKSFGK